VLAGDIFRGTPLRARLLAFRAVYYLGCLLDARRTFAAWRRRQRVARGSYLERERGADA
jgi:hypothetical protein